MIIIATIYDKRGRYGPFVPYARWNIRVRPVYGQLQWLAIVDPIQVCRSHFIYHFMDVESLVVMLLNYDFTVWRIPFNLRKMSWFSWYFAFRTCTNNSRSYFSSSVLCRVKDSRGSVSCLKTTQRTYKKCREVMKLNKLVCRSSFGRRLTCCKRRYWVIR